MSVLKNMLPVVKILFCIAQSVEGRRLLVRIPFHPHACYAMRYALCRSYTARI